MRLTYAIVVGALLATPAFAKPEEASVDPTFRGMDRHDGLLQTHIDRSNGRILFTLPAPAADGVSGRFLFTASLRTGLGAAPTFLDRGRIGATQVLAFRRIGKKVAAQFENPRFRATGADPLDPSGSNDFATSIVWMGDVVATLPDGSIVVDIADFLTEDMVGIADSLNQASDTVGTGDAPQGAGKGFHREAKLSAAVPGSLKAFPQNVEVDAVQTYVSDTPGDEVSNIAPEPKRVSFTVHASFVALPGPGFVPRRFDPRMGGFATQQVNFAAPLGMDVVGDFANRFRLEKITAGAAPSAVKKPIVYYVDSRAPQPIRDALVDGVRWWNDAFTAAGFIDAFRVETLPAGVDPLDVRYNIVNWDDRATRGWSYGQEIVDPRTGEIVKGMVVLGSLRTRQDIQIFEALVGPAEINSGSANDPVRVALTRMRQLGAHEVGHTLGFTHNFAASTQARASVMDYPPPRIGLVAGKPDLSDAYGVGIGEWDKASVAWLYGAPDDAAADAVAKGTVDAGLRYVHDGDARSPDTAQRWGGLWDDGADPTAELTRLMKVRRAAINGFGLAMLEPGEAVANLRRRFVPIWLLHRYEVIAAAKAIGGADFSYAVAGGGHEKTHPVSSTDQRAALDALLATLTPEALRVPDRLIPLLSIPRNGSDNRQFNIELFQIAHGPVFDPLVAADVGAEITLGSLLSPTRLARVSAQHAVDSSALGVAEIVDRLVAATVTARPDMLSQRIAYRTIVILVGNAENRATTPEVALLIDARLQTIAAMLARRGDGWATSLARKLLNPDERAKLLTEQRSVPLPPADPIGGDSGYMDW